LSRGLYSPQKQQSHSNTPQHDSYGTQPSSQVFDEGTALISKAKKKKENKTKSHEEIHKINWLDLKC